MTPELAAALALSGCVAADNDNREPRINAALLAEREYERASQRYDANGEPLCRRCEQVAHEDTGLCSTCWAESAP